MRIVFDFDDTLANSWRASQRGIKELSKFFLKKRMFKLVILMLFGKNEEFVKDESLLLDNSYRIIKKFIEFCYEKSDLKTVQEADNIFNKAFFSNLKLYPKAKIVLEKLKDHELILITDGDLEYQRKKIKFLDIEKYFKEIYISGETKISKNNPEAFKIIKKADYVIGDRIKTDIRGGKIIGAKTILFENGFFVKENRKSDIKPDYVVKDLEEILDIILSSQDREW
ncbi:MAG: HAD-IA family hydrolase [Methanomicrobia archaeon]|nr:HAD-IA family hydrolase [Methanomicrobia archaeon]